MENYNPQQIEKKWQKYWEKNKVNFYDLANKKKLKFYNLAMFYYPSGAKIHIGHGYNYTGSDVYGRFKRLNGFNVLEPMGADAFGLPAENYALKTGVHPAKTTKDNIDFGRRQLKELGLMYDWEKEINTSSPEYYRWTQWLFTVLYKAGLAYRALAPVNWCPSCKTVLANEQVIAGKCERCDSQVTQKNLKQWFFKITDYAERLLAGHKKLNWPEKTLLMQKNWIGRSEGAEVDFEIPSLKASRPMNWSAGDGEGSVSQDPPINWRVNQGDKLEVNPHMVSGGSQNLSPNPDKPEVNPRMVSGGSQNLSPNPDKLEVNPRMVSGGSQNLSPNPDKPEVNPRTLQEKPLTPQFIGGIQQDVTHPTFRPIHWSEQEVYFVTFPTYKREPFFQNETQAKKALKLFYEVIADKGYDILDLVVMPEHIHFPVKRKGNQDLQKIVKNLKGIVSRKFDHNQEHLWAKGFEYEKIKDQRSYQSFVNYLKNNPQKRGLKPDNRLLSNLNAWFRVFTTRPDTLFGATFMVLSPEHELVQKLKKQIKNWPEVEKYIQQSQKKTDIERTDLAKEKTGVELKGVKAINPVNNQKIPIYIADYVLSSYGTGAIMAVPAHDERDFEFALKYKLPIIDVIAPKDKMKSYFMPGSSNSDIESQLKGFDYQRTKKGGYYVSLSSKDLAPYIKVVKKNLKNDYWCEIIGSRNIFIFGDDELIEIKTPQDEEKVLTKCKKLYPKIRDCHDLSAMLWNCDFYHDLVCYADIDNGVLVNSGEFNGLPVKKCITEITIWLEKNNLGKKATNYRLRDWLISRQRYWGAPIPIIECEKCGDVLVKEKDLPVKLPRLKDFKPTSTGESPLARSKEFVNVKCPKCGAPARRSTETMDTFVCSSWYFLRFLTPHLKDKPFDKNLVKKWLPVDQYCGGAEHATLHLLYSRFITKVLYDQGYINFDEPFSKLNHQGMILAEDGSKMSKSKGNVVIPDDYVKKYGADVFRLYVLFLAPFAQGGSWSDKGIVGVKRFLDKVWMIHKRVNPRIHSGDSGVERLVHQTIKKVTEDIENFHFNTAISALMILVNELTRQKDLSIINYQLSIILLAPFAPHLAEELWHRLGHQDSIFNESWPKYKPQFIKENEIELVIQINGKVRDKLRVLASITESAAKKKALQSEKVKKWVEGKKVKKTIFVKGKLLNIVV